MTLSGTGPHGGSPENESAGGWAAHREREREPEVPHGLNKRTGPLLENIILELGNKEL